MLADHNDQAGPPRTNAVITPVDPTQTVLIDLAALYGRQPHFRRPNVQLLAAMTVMLVGQLEAWVLADTGWLGLCQYKIKLGFGDYLQQHHVVPAWAMRPATQWDIDQARMRGEMQL